MSTAQVESSDKVQNGVIEMTKAGNTSTSVDDFGGAGGGHWFGLMVGGAALAAVLAPLILPIVNGWTKNDTYPAVVGAGDTTCVYFDQKIKSLKGMWHGSAQVTSKSNPELSFRGKTKNSTWGNTISGKSVSNENNAMWVELTMPESADVVGKTIDLDVTVNATYPLEMNGGFDDMRDSFSHSESITMSAAGAGGTYWASWIYGQLGAFLLVIVGGLVLNGTAKGLVNRANPPEILVAGGDDEEEDDDYPEDDLDEDDDEV